ncbi:putative deacetylase complex subunit protein [Phaeoacremonium minimum UCRPA7]|uniref:Putative deacetylase complex subunit protein n=1 Tax=Phaeoacremonium minimum (strain UCR-PA7) TaxID=1286976 RepID=R8BY34_PHAM7|nr:putative deacetylase complex subunit protein [Phaeoacremonium minimum UCRPA7]EOO04263.1 putative deacetylase complex subunit protein [Phaeoacremonium minimum UCRPA7]
MAANASTAPSPPAAVPARHESKRERKRQLLTERLQQMSDNFTRSRDSAYREQLQKIQLDTNLVMRVDPYSERPLDTLDGQQVQLAMGQSTDPATARTLLDMAGPKFQDWVHKIEDLVEERDFEISKQKLEYERKIKEHRNVHAYKVMLAKREHDSLSNTVRDRLINTISTKKFRLSKEKEALEISDATALLLHPNQFSITNPASPGGTHGKRATRLRREMEEMPGFSDSKKRKRNGNEDDGSPAPQRRALDTSNTTPVWQVDRLRMGKSTGPVYSIDKLFTDKELSMNYNTAALASHKYLLRHKSKVNGNGVVSSPSEEGSGDEREDGDDAESIPSAPVMERQVSHATRSTRGGTHTANFLDNKLLGLEALANFELPENLSRLDAQDPKLPPLVPAPYNKAKPMSEANGPPALAQDDVSADMMAISVLRQYETAHGVGSNLDTSNGGRKVLEAVSSTPRDSKYVALIQGDRPSMEDLRNELRLSGGSGLTAGPTSVHGGIGASPMSRQSSLGGVAMSRQGTGGSTRGARRRGG